MSPWTPTPGSASRHSTTRGTHTPKTFSSSTLQVVNALMKANNNFDFLMIPGAEHNAGRGGEFGDYGERKRFDFFVRHLLGQDPPEWAAGVATTTTAGQ